VTFSVDSNFTLGAETAAHIKTGTLLGERVVTLESAGNGSMHPNDVIRCHARRRLIFSLMPSAT